MQYKWRHSWLALLDKVESTAQHDCLVTMSPSLAPANMCGIAPSLMISTQLRTSWATRHRAAQQYCRGKENTTSIIGMYQVCMIQYVVPGDDRYCGACFNTYFVWQYLVVSPKRHAVFTAKHGCVVVSVSTIIGITLQRKSHDLPGETMKPQDGGEL